MFKVILISLAVVCGAVAVPEVAVAPAAAVGVDQPLALQYLRGFRQLAALSPIQHIRTQQVLPIQDLDSNGRLVQLQNDEPVFVRFQTASAPVHVETSHIPSPPQETTVTQTEDHPHRVIHEVIRPVIQEVREIIQPYRKITQEIRPVIETVHTDVASNSGAAVAPVAVAAPAQAVVAAPALVSAPTQAVYGSPLRYGLSAPVANEVVANANGLGVIAAPAPLYTGSYIQAFLEQIRARQAQGPVIVSQPKVAIEAPAPVVVEEPVTAESVAPVASVVPINRGSLQFTQKHREY